MTVSTLYNYCSPYSVLFRAGTNITVPFNLTDPNLIYWYKKLINLQNGQTLLLNGQDAIYARQLVDDRYLSLTYNVITEPVTNGLVSYSNDFFTTEGTYDICNGPDGNLWISAGSGYVLRMTTSGVVTSYDLNPGIGGGRGLCTGPDGNIWVTNDTGINNVNNGLFKVTPEGVVTQYEITGMEPYDICVGSDGNLWVADVEGFVWKVTTSVQTTKYTLVGSAPTGICSGPDGNIWVVDANGNLWKVTTAGVPTKYVVTNIDTGFELIEICTGPDGNLWTTSYDTNNLQSTIYKVTTSGQATNYPLIVPGGYSGPWGLCAGPDGNVWVADSIGQIWKVTTAGLATRYALPGATPGFLYPAYICVGPDGNLWSTNGFGAPVWEVLLFQGG